MFMIKAIVAGIVAAAGSLGVAATDGHISLVEALAAIGVTAVAVGAVYSAPKNTITPPAPDA